MIKYRLIWYKNEIKEIEVKRETAKFIYLTNGERVSKETEFCSFYNSFNEAKESLVKRLKEKIEFCKEMLEACEKRLKYAELLTNDPLFDSLIREAAPNEY